MSRYTDYTDHELIPLLNISDETAFRELYERYARHVFQYVTAILDDRKSGHDVVQEIFVDVWERRGTLYLATTSLTFLPYLTRAAKNKVIDHVRSDVVHKKYSADFAAMMSAYSNDSEETVALNELRDLIEKSIQQLPERIQMAFRLSRYEHLPLPEIAKRMNISTRAVENYVSKALAHLRGSLGEMIVLVWWLNNIPKE